MVLLCITMSGLFLWVVRSVIYYYVALNCYLLHSGNALLQPNYVTDWTLYWLSCAVYCCVCTPKKQIKSSRSISPLASECVCGKWQYIVRRQDEHTGMKLSASFWREFWINVLGRAGSREDEYIQVYIVLFC